MTTPRLHLLVVLLCLTALLFEARTLTAQTVLSPEIQRRIESVGTCLTIPVVERDDPHVCQTLQDRLAADRVPGVSIAVIHNGAVEWAQGFGVVQLAGGAGNRRDSVPGRKYPQTSFRDGGASTGARRQAIARLGYQSGAHLVEGSPSAAAPGAVVTLRELLTHTAGLTVRGFLGYAAGAPIPTLVQILNGENPANIDPVRLEAPPGRRWKYSGRVHSDAAATD
jgi:CubicO group peptidase (beta-lactamase class C family)